MFQLSTKLKIIRDTSPPLAAGTTTWQRIRICPAPSRAAASRSSSGIPSITWRIQNTPKGAKIPGRITDRYEPISPAAFSTI